MPRLAANLSMMFNEVPFLDRFSAARKAGFDGVEFLEFAVDQQSGRRRPSRVVMALRATPSSMPANSRNRVATSNNKPKPKGNGNV